MAVPIFKTPAQYAISFANFNNPDTRLLLEIYNQLYNSSLGDMQSLDGTTDGTADFTDGLLIGKTVFAVWVDGIKLAASGAYTFDNTTGTITFVNIPDTGLDVFVLYS